MRGARKMKIIGWALLIGATAALAACDDEAYRAPAAPPEPVPAPVVEAPTTPAVTMESPPPVDQSQLPPPPDSSEETVQPESETLFY